MSLQQHFHRLRMARVFETSEPITIGQSVYLRMIFSQSVRLRNVSVHVEISRRSRELHLQTGGTRGTKRGAGTHDQISYAGIKSCFSISSISRHPPHIAVRTENLLRACSTNYYNDHYSQQKPPLGLRTGDSRIYAGRSTQSTCPYIATRTMVSLNGVR